MYVHVFRLVFIRGLIHFKLMFIKYIDLFMHTVLSLTGYAFSVTAKSVTLVFEYSHFSFESVKMKLNEPARFKGRIPNNR